LIGTFVEGGAGGLRDPAGVAFAGGDSVVLPSQFEYRSAFSLGTVVPSFPRGGYRLGCRLLNPVTGSLESAGSICVSETNADASTASAASEW
jgi:hypothetical protein